MFMSNIVCHSSMVSVPRGLGPVKYPALEMRMSSGFPLSSWEMFLNAEFTDCSFEMSVGIVRIFVLEPTRECRVDFAWRRISGRRPRMMRVEGEARATDFAMARPIPEPPPVRSTAFPASERSGRRGEMVG